MPPELCFEGRNNKSFDEKDVQFLRITNVQPARVHWRICGHKLTPVAQRLLQEARRLFHILGGQCQMGEDSVLLPYSKPLAIHLDQ